MSYPSGKSSIRDRLVVARDRQQELPLEGSEGTRPPTKRAARRERRWIDEKFQPCCFQDQLCISWDQTEMQTLKPISGLLDQNLYSNS